MKYDLIEVQSPDDWKDYHFLRRTVLWEAKGRHNNNENHADERVKANHPLLLKLHDLRLAQCALTRLATAREL